MFEVFSLCVLSKEIVENLKAVEKYGVARYFIVYCALVLFVILARRFLQNDSCKVILAK